MNREPIAFIEDQRLRAVVTLDVIAVLGSLYNGYLAVTHGLFLTLAFQLTFIILLAAGNITLLATRNIQVALIPLIAALLTMIASTVVDAGGLTGLGFFFLLPVFPIMYIIVGIRWGTFLILLGGAGMVLRLALGHFLPTSVYNSPEMAFRMGVLIAYTTLVVFLVNFRIDAFLERLTRLALMDFETGLSGRWNFEPHLRARLRRPPRNGLDEGLAVVGFKILNFSRVNAMEGPRRSEAVLRELGHRVGLWQNHVEISSRWQSSLFLSVLDTNDFLEIDTSCRELLSLLSKPVIVEDRPISLLCSIAVTRFPEDADGAEDLIGNVITTLDRASAMPDELIFFDKAKHDAERHRYRLFESLVKGDFDEGFSLHYQPKVRFTDGACGGAEVLMRWNHPVYGFVSPGEFISLAEEIGSIRRLTRTMISRVFSDLRTTAYLEASEGLEPVIAINLSMHDLRDQELLPFVNRELKSAGLSPSLIEFEITEGTLIDDNPWIRINMENLLALDFRLAIDDFGTGYSSLSYLHRLKVHDLKIDQSFVRELSEAEGHRESPVIDAIVSMGKSLGLEITAEGVETPFQADYLADRGVDLAQGWLYSKSLPWAEFLEFIRSHRGTK